MKPCIRSMRWHDVIIGIYKSNENKLYCQKLNRKLKLTLTYVHDIVKQLEQKKFIKIKPKSKTKYISLTKTGKKVACLLLSIRQLIKGSNEEDTSLQH